jgi:hypothetical protein
VTGGAELSRAYFAEVVQPLLAAHVPAIEVAAGRFGPGSDVLGLDDGMSRDHDWGLRLTLFVPEPAVARVDAALADALPPSFRGHPTRFAFTGGSEVRHRVEVTSLEAFLLHTLGFDPRDGMSSDDWLSLSGQSVLEATAGPVFADPGGRLAEVRGMLTHYPDDIQQHVLACDWERIAEELPFVGRTAESGDDRGSRNLAARLVSIVMHLAFVI